MRAHLQLDYSMEGDDQNDEVVHHVDDTRGKEEPVDVDTFPLGSTELRPEVGHWPAGTGHGNPNDNRIGEGEKIHRVSWPL